MKMKQKKDKFADLDSEFKDSIASKNSEEVRRIISDVALNEEENRRAREEDEDLKEKKEQAKLAAEGYKEASKMNNLKIKFARQLLEARGEL